jgi:hypothetical protein
MPEVDVAYGYQSACKIIGVTHPAIQNPRIMRDQERLPIYRQFQALFREYPRGGKGGEVY